MQPSPTDATTVSVGVGRLPAKPVLTQTEINDSLKNRFLAICRGDSGPQNGIEHVVIDPQREYTIACQESLLRPSDVLHLGTRYGSIRAGCGRTLYTVLELTIISVAWRAIQTGDGQLTASAEQRVRDATDS